MPPTAVTVVTLKPESTLLTRELTGRAEASQIAEVRPQVSGIVRRRLFEQGSEVRAGQALFQIDPAAFQAAMRGSSSTAAG